jgi:hypothetical protein
LPTAAPAAPTTTALRGGSCSLSEIRVLACSWAATEDSNLPPAATAAAASGGAQVPVGGSGSGSGSDSGNTLQQQRIPTVSRAAVVSVAMGERRPQSRLARTTTTVVEKKGSHRSKNRIRVSSTFYCGLLACLLPSGSSSGSDLCLRLTVGHNFQWNSVLSEANSTECCGYGVWGRW